MESVAGAGQGGRARLVSGLASLALHALAAAGVLAVSGVEPPSIPHGPARLTVVTLKAEAHPPAPKAPGAVQSRAGGEPRPVRPPTLPIMPRPALAGAAASAQPAAPAPAPAPRAEAALPALPPPPPPPTARREQSDDAFAAYRQTLWRHIAARAPRGTQPGGEATVRFRLSPSGALLSAEIAGSSGSANLARIALRTLRLASPLPAPPAGVSADRLVFTLPVRFH